MTERCPCDFCMGTYDPGTTEPDEPLDDYPDDESEEE